MALLDQPDLFEIGLGPLGRLLAAETQHLDRRHRDVFEYGQVRPEVEPLEHHADAASHPVDLPAVDPGAALALLGEANGLVLEADGARFGRFEEVDAAQERALSRAAGADHRHHVVAARHEVEPLENGEAAEVFTDPRDFQNRVALNVHGDPIAGGRMRGRSTHPKVQFEPLSRVQFRPPA